MLAMNHDSCTRKIIQTYFQKRQNALPTQSKHVLVVCIQKSVSPLSIAVKYTGRRCRMIHIWHYINRVVSCPYVLCSVFCQKMHYHWNTAGEWNSLAFQFLQACLFNTKSKPTNLILCYEGLAVLHAFHGAGHLVGKQQQHSENYAKGF